MSKDAVSRMIGVIAFIIVACGDRAWSEADSSPWGIAGSSSSSNNRDEWFPRMAAAGISAVRLFPEWRSLEPTRGQWTWGAADALVASAARNKLEINGILMGSAWENPKGHAFPMQSLNEWATYVGAVTHRYKGQVHYWEVWNEGNGGFNDDHNTANDYAKLAAAAYAAAKKNESDAQIGLSVASFDPAYFDHAIRAMAADDAADSFDFLAIHPYEIADGLTDPDGEIPFLWMTHSLREMLHRAAPQREQAPIWITEIGRKVGSGTTEESAAAGLVKLYTMALAQGIQRTEWFEGQDPTGEEAGFGLIEREGKPRAAYAAMKLMISPRFLGPTPKYLGWLTLGEGARGYGFVFQGASSPVLVAWMPAGEVTKTLAFTKDVTVTSFRGTPGEYVAGRPIALDDSPIFVNNAPPDLVATATANANRPFPWGGEFSKSTSVSTTLGKPAGDSGLFQVARRSTPQCTYPDGSTGIILRGDQGVQFFVHPSFASLETREFYVKVTVRRLAPGNLGMNCYYAFADGLGKAPYKNVGEWYSVGKEDDWQTHTWHFDDACFSKMWGYDISIRAEQSVPFVIGKVEVSKTPFK